MRAALDDIAGHPEITLSRRDILRFILVEPTKRSEEIQTILKLEEIGDIPKRAQDCPKPIAARLRDGRCAGADQAARALQTPSSDFDLSGRGDVLAAVNQRRKIL